MHRMGSDYWKGTYFIAPDDRLVFQTRLHTETILDAAFFLPTTTRLHDDYWCRYTIDQYQNLVLTPAHYLPKQKSEVYWAWRYERPDPR